MDTRPPSDPRYAPSPPSPPDGPIPSADKAGDSPGGPAPDVGARSRAEWEAARPPVETLTLGPLATWLYLLFVALVFLGVATGFNALTEGTLDGRGRYVAYAGLALSVAGLAVCVAQAARRERARPRCPRCKTLVDLPTALATGRCVACGAEIVADPPPPDPVVAPGGPGGTTRPVRVEWATRPFTGPAVWAVVPPLLTMALFFALVGLVAPAVNAYLDGDGPPAWERHPEATVAVLAAWMLANAFVAVVATPWCARRARRAERPCPACGRAVDSAWVAGTGYCDRCGAALASDPIPRAELHEKAMSDRHAATMSMVRTFPRRADVAAHADELAAARPFWWIHPGVALTAFCLWAAAFGALALSGWIGWPRKGSLGEGAGWMWALFFVGLVAEMAGLVYWQSKMARCRGLCPWCGGDWSGARAAAALESGRCPRCGKIALADGPWPVGYERPTLAEWTDRYTRYDRALRDRRFWRAAAGWTVAFLAGWAVVETGVWSGVLGRYESVLVGLYLGCGLFAGMVFFAVGLYALHRRAAAESGLACPRCGVGYALSPTRWIVEGGRRRRGPRFLPGGRCPDCQGVVVADADTDAGAGGPDRERA